MSLESDKEALGSLLETARSRVEQAIASFNNGDFDKCKFRIQQYNDSFDEANKMIGIVVEKADAIAAGEASKDLDNP